MTRVGWIEIVMLAVTACAVLAFVRLVVGKTLPDRVVALDLVGTAAVALLALASVRYDVRALLDVAIVLALVAFIGTVAFARFLEEVDGDD